MSLGNETEPARTFETMVAVAIPIVFSFIAFVGMTGNSLVVLVLAVSPAMRNSTNLLIGNLALSDLVFLWVTVPFTAASYVSPLWLWGEWACPAIAYGQFASVYVSVWTLVLLSGDRWAAVVHPLASRALRRPAHSARCVAALWALVLLACLPILPQHRLVHYTYMGQNRSSCVYLSYMRKSQSPHAVRAYHLSFNVFGYALPLAVCSVLYASVVRKLWAAKPTGRSGPTSERFRCRLRVTRMLAGVVGVFGLSCLPLHVSYFMLGLQYPDSFYVRRSFVTFKIAAQVLAYTNSCLNPLLYAAFSDSFRKGFLRLVRCDFSSGPAELDGLYNTFRDATLFLERSVLSSNNRRRRRRKATFAGFPSRDVLSGSPDAAEAKRRSSRPRATRKLTIGCELDGANRLQVPRAEVFRSRSLSSCPNLNELSSSEFSTRTPEQPSPDAQPGPSFVLHAALPYQQASSSQRHL